MSQPNTLTSADVLQGQLTDILVTVDRITLATMSDRDKFRVLDWVEDVKSKIARQQFVPACEVNAVRRWLNGEQLAGKWTAFTTWRPAESNKQQRGLFE